MVCEHTIIKSALDRWQESHWHLHQIEQNYHHADNLRYSVNAFLRSLKEIPQMVTMATQGQKEFARWQKKAKSELYENNLLISKLFTHRDVVVHQSMLVPKSKASVATIRGNTIKMALEFPVDPFEDSDMAIQRFVAHCKKHPILKSILAPDEIQLLAIIREWQIDGIDGEIIDEFREGWLKVGTYLSDVMEFTGGTRLPERMPECFKDARNYRYKKYPQIQLE